MTYAVRSSFHTRVMREYAVSPTYVEVHSRQVRRLCQACHERRARFRYRGEVRADRDHTLCFECYRAERNRQRLAGPQLAERATAGP